MKNLKAELNNGYRAIGSMVWAFGESFIPQIYKNTGYDCLIIDMEHSAFSYETVQTLVQTCRLCDLFPIVRVAEADKEILMKVWDMGAGGVIVPMIESAEQAAQFVRFSKYPPLGTRGMGPGLGNMDYRPDQELEQYIKQVHENQILLVQPETKAGVINIDKILAVEGIDGILTGPYDLSASLGVAGQFDNPEYKEAVRKLIKTTLNKGKLAAGFATNKAQAEELAGMGVNLMISGLDSVLLHRAAAKLFADLKSVFE